MHNVFHVSTLKKYVQDQSHIIQNVTDLEIQHDILYVEKIVKILCREDKVLRRKTILLVEVLWNNQVDEECMWETEEDMRRGYILTYSKCNDAPLLEWK